MTQEHQTTEAPERGTYEWFVSQLYALADEATAFQIDMCWVLHFASRAGQFSRFASDGNTGPTLGYGMLSRAALTVHQLGVESEMEDMCDGGPEPPIG